MKERPSKLDAAAGDLDRWLTPADQGGQGLTFKAACECLKRQKGIQAGPSLLRQWWRKRQAIKLQAAMLEGNPVAPVKICQGGTNWGLPNKQRPSKLDPFASELDNWLAPADEGGEGVSFKEAAARLARRGLIAKPQLIIYWWNQRRARKEQAARLSRPPADGGPDGTGGKTLTDENAGVQQNTPPHSAGLVAQRHGQVARAAQSAGGTSDPRDPPLPAPSLDQLIQKIISTGCRLLDDGDDELAKIRAANDSAQKAVNAGFLSVKQAAQNLAERKFQYRAVKQVEKQYSTVKAVMEDGGASNEERTERLGRIVFGPRWVDTPQPGDASGSANAAESPPAATPSDGRVEPARDSSETMAALPPSPRLRRADSRDAATAEGMVEATPLSHGGRGSAARGVTASSKAPSPLRSAGALQDLAEFRRAARPHEFLSLH